MLNPYQEYKKQAVMTMTPGDMIVKLFDECLAMLNLGVKYIEENKVEDIEARVNALKKARNILNYLRSILNMDYEISHELWSLYEYYISQIVTANSSAKKEPLLEVIEMITDLRNSFFEANKIVRTK